MSKHGVSLGADIYELYSAGHSLLPTVAQQFDAAYGNTPASISYKCTRGGGLGISATGPGDILDTLLDQLDLATSTTSKNLRAVGEAMEWVALKQFKHADEQAKTEYTRKTKSLGG